MGNNLITNTRVFEFCGVHDDQRTTQGNIITNLITQTQSELETELRRSLNAVTVTSQIFNDGDGCEISGNKIRFINKYRDFYSITAVTEEGTALTASTAYNDDNDYIYYASTGILEKITGNWSVDYNAIVISGIYGYLDSNNAYREEIKKLLTEMVAAKSGLWTINTGTPDGNISNTKTTISKDAEKTKLSHINYYL